MDPPSTSYRWKHRLCTLCENTLALNGFISLSGHYIQEGLCPSGAACGAVYLPGVSLKPKPGKFQGFLPLEGRVEVKLGGLDYRPLKPEDLETLPKSQDRKARSVLVAAAISGATPVVSNRDCYNAAKGLFSRAFREVPNKPQHSSYRAIRRFEDYLMPGLFFEPVQVMQIKDWINTMPSNRVEKLLKAWEEKERFPTFQHRWAIFKAFIKAEKLCGFVQDPQLGPLPLTEMIDRIIQGPNDVTHIIAGPGLKPTTIKLKKLWNHEFPIFYAACNAQTLNKWFNERYRPGMWALLGDYEMFDGSHNDMSWDYMESIYERLGLMNIQWFSDVMRVWRRPQGTMNGGKASEAWHIRYKAYTMNASGRDDTALANAVMNGVCYALSLIAAINGTTVGHLNEQMVAATFPDLHISIMGDDSLVLLDDRHMTPGFEQLLQDNIASFGFRLKFKASQNPFDFVYLGMRPYPAHGQWWFARTAGRALFKWGWKLDLNNKDGPAAMTGDAFATSKIDAIVPVLSDLAETYLTTRRGCKSTHLVADPNKPWRCGDPDIPHYTEQTLQYTAQGYGFSVTELRDCIDYVRRQSTFPCILDHPVLTTIMVVDDM